MFRFARISRFSVAIATSSALLLTMTREAYAVGQAVGRVNGTVIEAQSQAPVPGATVTLTGGSGVRKVVQTSEDGTYQILEIPPGVYELVISYEGMKPIRRRVEVRPDAATPVNVEWSAEAAEVETTVVEEERTLTNPDSPQTGQIYSIQRTNQLPIGRFYQNIATQIPGVTTNGGGNPSVKGGTSANNRYLLNGLDLTDPVSNTFSGNIQQDALETVQVATGGYEAKYNALGAIVSLQTRRGTNEFHGAASAYWAPQFLVDYDTFGPQLYHGARRWDYSQKRPQQGRYELNLTAQGPILKDHLFFNAGIQYSKTFSVQPAGPPRFVQAPSRNFQTVYLLAGITYVPVNNHRFHFEITGDPTSLDYETNDGAGANSSIPQAQRGRTQGGYRFTTEWAWQASKNVATKVMVGQTQTELDIGPQGIRGIEQGDLYQGVAYDFRRSRHLNTDDSTAWWNDFSHTVSTRRRTQIDASVTVTGEAAGRHEAELGLTSAFFQHRDAASFTGGTAGPYSPDGFGLTYRDRGGGLLDAGLCDMDPAINPGVAQGNYTGNGCFQRTFNQSYVGHQTGNVFGVYIQDRWKPRKWLTILPGLRWDTGTVRITDSDVAVTGQGFGPRFSVIADVTNDSKTIVQASYGRMTELPYLLGVSAFDSRRRNFSVTEAYNPQTRQFEFFQAAGGAQGVRFNYDRQAASVDEILLSARREIAQGFTGRIDYTYRHYRRMFQESEVNAIMDPTGTRTIGWANGDPTRVLEYGYNRRAYNQYSGIDFIGEARLKNFEFQGGYTLSWSYGPGTVADTVTGAGTAFENPRFSQFYNSYQLGIDTRHQIKTSTTYSFFGFTVGVVLNWRSGVPFRHRYPSNEGGYTIVRAPNGYDPGAFYNTGTSNPGQNGTFSDVRSWATARTPDVLTANLMITYDLHKLVGQHIIANAAITNVLALPNAVGVNETESAPNSNQYGLASGRMPFRSVQLGARYEF